jgi:redox-sensitive bicupin YhaK (pirin superfamily)
MITLRSATERHHDRRRIQADWRPFQADDREEVLTDGFGSLELLNENRLPPGASVPRHPPCDAEIVTYVREGALAYEDSAGCSGAIQAGEFQRTTSGCGIWHSERNSSSTEWAHIFQMWVRPSRADLAPNYEQRRFSAAERRGMLCIVASPDARKGSLHINQDALLYSAMLDPGQHVIHELTPGRSAWLHIVEGQATLEDTALTTGDGAGVTDECAVSLTAREKTEILLLDIRADVLRPRDLE